MTDCFKGNLEKKKTEKKKEKKKKKKKKKPWSEEAKQSLK